MRRVSCGWTPMTMPSSGLGRPFLLLADHEEKEY